MDASPIAEVRTMALATALNPVIGYTRAAEVAKASQRTGRSILEIVLERGILSEEEIEKILDLKAMTDGGLPE